MVQFAPFTAILLGATGIVSAVNIDGVVGVNSSLSALLPNSNPPANVDTTLPFRADDVPAGFFPPRKGVANVATICIGMSSTNDGGFYYRNDMPWSGAGTLASLNGQLCVPTSDTAGGAVFIGTEPNPGAGSTKLECFFGTTGQGYCDVSLVDGYSLAVQCTIGGGPDFIGGTTDLWTTGEPCLDTSLEGQGICKNDLGYSASEATVSPFFQKGIQNGNSYWIWVNASHGYQFDATQGVSCHVSGSHGPGK